MKKYIKNKQLSLTYLLFNKNYSDYDWSEKNKINSNIESLMKRYESVPLITEDINFEYRERLKNFMVKNILTKKKLLHKCKIHYSWFIKNGFEEEYTLIFNTTFYLKNININERMYNIINDLKSTKLCENPTCNNITKFNGFSLGYKKFCCIKCSKNPEKLKIINLFNGVNKSEIPISMRGEKKIYWYNVRRMTDILYKKFKHIINPNNKLIGLNGVEGAHQIDHIISIKEGFIRGLPPEYIANLDNLQVIPWEENSRKGSKRQN